MDLRRGGVDVLYVVAGKPTDAVTAGVLPAAARRGVGVVVLTDQPAAFAGAPVPVLETDVRDPGAIAGRVRRHGPAAGLLSNSDHLQVPTSLAAELLGVPGKSWAAGLRCKNKFLMRRTLADAGLDAVRCAELGPGDEVVVDVPFPAVVKPREGVASEDVLLACDAAELAARVAEIRERRPGASLVVEEYLAGEVRTYDTLGDGKSLWHFGSWRTTLGAPPYFAELRLEWDPVLLPTVEAGLRAQLAALGVGFGACHTEFVIDGDRARIIEVNYRLIGDTMDLVCAELLQVDLFAELIRVYLGEPLDAGLPDPARLPRHARVDYVCADRSGTLLSAPAALAAELPGGVRLGHRPLRTAGVSAPLTGTNRDYLSAVHAIGPDEPRVAAALDGFLAGNRWVIGS